MITILQQLSTGRFCRILQADFPVNRTWLYILCWSDRACNLCFDVPACHELGRKLILSKRGRHLLSSGRLFPAFFSDLLTPTSVYDLLRALQHAASFTVSRPPCYPTPLPSLCTVSCRTHFATRYCSRTLFSMAGAFVYYVLLY